MKLSAGQLFAKPSEPGQPFRPGGFWPMFNAAWAAICRAGGEHHVDDHKAMEDWRHEEQLVCGFDSLTKVDRTKGFNKVMSHFAQIAGNWEAVAYFADGDERCMRHAVERVLLPQLCELEQREIPWAYVQEICRRQGLPASMDDCTTEHWRGIVSALSRQIRAIKTAREQHTPAKGNEGLGSHRWRKESAFQHLGAA